MTTPAVQEAASVPAILAGQAIDFGHLTPETSISLNSAGREYRLSARDVIRWVAPNAPISDAVKMLVIAQNTGLNPMLGEIELIEFGGKWTPFIRKNGHVRHALGSDLYDGHESGVVVQVKDRSRPPHDVAGTLTPHGFILVGGWAKVYRKGISRPVYKRVPLGAYDRGSGTWNTNPGVMIEKVAIAQALRESFPIGDTYDEAEGPETYQTVAPLAGVDSAPAIQATQRAAALAAPSSADSQVAESIILEPEVIENAEPLITSAQMERIATLADQVGMSDPDYQKMIRKRGVDSIDQLTAVQAQEIINRLVHVTSRKEWNPLPDPAPAPADDAASVVLPETVRA